jgi:hypothetical protein
MWGAGPSDLLSSTRDMLSHTWLLKPFPAASYCATGCLCHRAGSTVSSLNWNTWACGPSCTTPKPCTQAHISQPLLLFSLFCCFFSLFFGGTSIRIKDLAPVMQAHCHLKQVSSAFCFSKSANRFDCSFPELGLPLLGLQVWATRVQLVCSNRTLNILPRMSLNCDSPDLLKVAEIIVPQPYYLNKIQLGNPTGFHIE